MKKNRNKFLIFFAVAILVFALCFIFSEHPDKYEDWDDGVSSSVLYADGHTEYFENNSFGIVNKGDMVHLYVRLPQTMFIKDACLRFHVYNCTVQAYHNGTEIYSYGFDYLKEGKLIGGVFPHIDIQPEYWGDTVEIVLGVQNDYAFSSVSGFRMYQQEESMRYYVDLSSFSALLSTAGLLVSGIVLLILMTQYKNTLKTKRRLCIALIAFLYSMRIFTGNGVYNIFSQMHIWAYFEYLSLFFMPVPQCYYMYVTVNNKKIRNYLGILTLINLSFIVVSILLESFGIMNFAQMLVGNQLLTVLSALSVIICGSVNLFKKNFKNKYQTVGICIISAINLYDVAVYVLNKFSIFPPVLSNEIRFSYELIILLLFLCIIYYIDLRDEQKKNAFVTGEFDSLRDTIAAVPAGVCVFKLEDNYPILVANEGFYAILGRPPEEYRLDGKSSVFYGLGEEKQRKFTAGFGARSEEAGSYFEYEFETAKKDGTPIAVLARVNINNDKRIAIVNAIDVTKRKRAENRLAVSEQSYKLALTRSGKIFFFLDLQTHTVMIADEIAKNYFGIEPKIENMPESVIDMGLIAPESIEDFRHMFERAYSGDASGEVFVSCHHISDLSKYLYCRFVFTSVFDVNNKPVSAILTFEDLTEQHEKDLAYRRLMQSLLVKRPDSFLLLSKDAQSDTILALNGSLFPDVFTSESADAILDEIGKKYIGAEDVEKYYAFIAIDDIKFDGNGNFPSKSTILAKKNSSGEKRWLELKIQITENPYANKLSAYYIFEDADDNLVNQMKLRQDIAKLKEELENSRIKIMINQMQPHFLYNALSAIRTIIRHEPDRAYDLLYDFTVHLRSCTKALTNDAPIPFEEELNNVRAYMNIEMMRFEGMLTVEYDIRCKDFLVVPLSIQPLVENASRHGLFPMFDDGGGTIWVRTYETDDYYVVEVEDNGVGFDVEDTLAKKQDSFGLRNIIFRLKTLMNAQIIFDSRLGEGTKVTVKISKDREEIDEYDTCG